MQKLRKWAELNPRQIGDFDWIRWSTGNLFFSFCTRNSLRVGTVVLLGIGDVARFTIRLHTIAPLRESVKSRCGLSLLAFYAILFTHKPTHYRSITRLRNDWAASTSMSI